MDASSLDNAISIIENEIPGLERYIDGLGLWLWASSIAVVLGVATEMYFITHKYADDRKAWRKGWISSTQRPSLLMFVLELTSVFLVVLGIAGELVVGIMSGNANASLRGKNTQLVRLVRLKAVDADTRATTAADDAAKASTHEEQLEMRTEREIEARLALEKQLVLQGPRTVLLYGRRRTELVNELKVFAGQKVEVRTCDVSMNQYNIDHDAMGVALLLSGVLGTTRGIEHAGWNASFPIVRSGCNGVGIMVSVLPAASGSTKEAAKALVSALARVPLVTSPAVFDISETGEPFPPDVNTVVITVFSHP